LCRYIGFDSVRAYTEIASLREAECLAFGSAVKTAKAPALAVEQGTDIDWREGQILWGEERLV
jgi:hypothetical protein